MILEENLVKELNLAKESLENMPISQRIQAWQEIHGTKLDTSRLTFSPQSIPNKGFDPENINSIFDIEITYDKGSNKIEPLNLSSLTNQDTQSFESAQNKSAQDIKDLGNTLYEGIKLVDITGLLHWEDYAIAQENFEKEPNLETSLNLVLCSLAVIPAVGVATAPSRMFKSGVSHGVKKALKDLPKDLSKLSQAEKGLRLSPIIKEADNLLKSKKLPESLDQVTLNRALVILDRKRNKVNPTIPANVFKEMVREFKESGGKFRRSDGYDTVFSLHNNTIRLGPKDYTKEDIHFRSVIAHEMAHSFTSPRSKSLESKPLVEPTFVLNTDPTKNPYEKVFFGNDFKKHIDSTIYDELNADLEVLKRMRLGGASKAQMNDYATEAISSIKTYKQGLLVMSSTYYSDAIAVKKVLLSNKELSRETSKILSEKPELMSDFDSLLNTLSQNLEQSGKKELSKKILETATDGQVILKSQLEAQKTAAKENFRKVSDHVKDLLAPKDVNGKRNPKVSGQDNKMLVHAMEIYLQKNLDDFDYFKEVISKNVKSFRVRELEAYTLKPKAIEKSMLEQHPQL